MSRTRAYKSSRREEQARQTRLLIRSAARELFSKHGFAMTTVADIAAQAGVAAATIYAIYDSKAGIVSAMLEELEEGVDMGRRLDELFAEPVPHRQLQKWLDAHCALFEGGADILRASLQAAEASEVVALFERGDTNRRRVIEHLVLRWEEAGALRSSLTQLDAADRMYLLTTVESYLTAVDRLGWSSERYKSWLGELLAQEILRILPSDSHSTGEWT